MTPDLLLAFDDEQAAAQALAAALGVPWALVQRHRFPDGESKLRLPATVPAKLLVLLSVMLWCAITCCAVMAALPLLVWASSTSSTG